MEMHITSQSLNGNAHYMAVTKWKCTLHGSHFVKLHVTWQSLHEYAHYTAVTQWKCTLHGSHLVEMHIKDSIFCKMCQLEIIRKDEHRVTSLTFSRLFPSKVVTCRKQRGDACSDLGSWNVLNKHSCAEKSFWGVPKRWSKVRNFNLWSTVLPEATSFFRKTWGQLNANRSSCSSAFPHHLIVMTSLLHIASLSFIRLNSFQSCKVKQTSFKFDLGCHSTSQHVCSHWFSVCFHC